MGNCVSSSFSDWVFAVRARDVTKISQLVAQHPELMSMRVDKEHGHTALHVAILYRDNGLLRHLLSCAELISHRDGVINLVRTSDSATPLMLACEAGDQQAVRLLLEAGADPWLRDHPYRRTCLHYAAAHGHVAAMRAVVHSTFNTTASKAWSSGNINSDGPVIDSARSTPASPFRRHSNSSRGLTTATSRGKPLVDLATCGGLTPLMYATCCGHNEAVHALMELGANPMLTCWDSMSDPVCTACSGSSALHVAAVNGSLRSALAILNAMQQEAARSLREMRDSMGCTPYQVAACLSHSKMLCVLDAANPLGWTKAEEPEPSAMQQEQQERQLWHSLLLHSGSGSQRSSRNRRGTSMCATVVEADEEEEEQEDGLSGRNEDADEDATVAAASGEPPHGTSQGMSGGAKGSSAETTLSSDEVVQSCGVAACSCADGGNLPPTLNVSSWRVSPQSLHTTASFFQSSPLYILPEGPDDPEADATQCSRLPRSLSLGIRSLGTVHGSKAFSKSSTSLKRFASMGSRQDRHAHPRRDARPSSSHGSPDAGPLFTRASWRHASGSHIAGFKDSATDREVFSRVLQLHEQVLRQPCAGCGRRSSGAMHVRQSVAQIAKEHPEQDLDSIIAACRHHRLLHGVRSAASQQPQ